MVKLIYTMITSLDGYIADQHGEFDWSAPDEEVHAFINGLERPIGTYLLGRRMYEVMRFWDTAGAASDPLPVIRDYARIWQAADKVVYSTTLDRVPSVKTRVERTFDPADVLKLKFSADRDISIGGAELAGQALAAGLVDEVRLFLAPVVVGGGKRSLPDGVRLDMELLTEHRFTSDAVYLRYRTLSSPGISLGRETGDGPAEAVDFRLPS
ncbi:MAG: deaminase reductase [Cryobacterium sp.]|jgi:dihydrofolate reductase|nr:deaminase reductase [Cryobacterium sp.]